MSDSPTVQRALAFLDKVKATLQQKNARYGDSAASPMRVFSRASAEQGIRVRIDDKLSRLSRGAGEMATDEDTVLDLVGYLALLAGLREEQRPEASAVQHRGAPIKSAPEQHVVVLPAPAAPAPNGHAPARVVFTCVQPGCREEVVRGGPRCAAHLLPVEAPEPASPTVIEAEAVVVEEPAAEAEPESQRAIPPELRDAPTVGAVVVYLLAHGHKTVDQLVATCRKLRDQVKPLSLLKSEERLVDRVGRAAMMCGLGEEGAPVPGA